MDATVRACVWPDEYESDWEYTIFVPDGEYWSTDTVKQFFASHTGHVYDLPKDLVERYWAAMAARNEVDEELVQIVKEKRGKVEPDNKSPGLPPV